MTGRWRVCKRNQVWRIYDSRGYWHDSSDTLEDAHTYATQLAVADVLFEPGGLTRLRQLSRDAAAAHALRWERDSRQWWAGVPQW